MRRIAIVVMGVVLVLGLSLPADAAESRRVWHSSWRKEQVAHPNCSAFAWEMWLTAEPHGLDRPPIPPFRLYTLMQAADGILEPHDGSTVEAGAKVLLDLGYISEWHEAASFSEVTDFLLRTGPVTVGSPWPISGQPYTSHVYVLDGIDVAAQMIRVHNSYPIPNGNFTWRIHRWFTYDQIAKRLFLDGVRSAEVILAV